MHFMHPSWSRRAAILVACSSATAGACADEVTVLARLQNQRLQIIERSGLAAPLHFAGFYVEWANEQEFLLHQHLVEGATYRVVSSVSRAEMSRFPEGWGARAGKPYSTYYVQAKSATRVEDKK